MKILSSGYRVIHVGLIVTVKVQYAFMDKITASKLYNYPKTVCYATGTIISVCYASSHQHSYNSYYS